MTRNQRNTMLLLGAVSTLCGVGAMISGQLVPKHGNLGGLSNAELAQTGPVARLRTQTGQEITSQRSQRRVRQPLDEPSTEKDTMNTDNSQQSNNTPPHRCADPPTLTRRNFLGGSGKKAAFVVPVVAALTAQQAQASPVCGSHGEVCAADGDCCSNVCSGGMMCTCLGMGMACTNDDACCSLSCDTFSSTCD